jgi:hypothetical protein
MSNECPEKEEEFARSAQLLTADLSHPTVSSRAVHCANPHVTRMEQNKRLPRPLIESSEGKRPPAETRLRPECNMGMDVTAIQCESVDWIQLAHVMVQLLAP